MWDYIVAELRWKPTKDRHIQEVFVYNGDVVKSDRAIARSSKDSLKFEVSRLEGVLSKEKDYHPGSDGQIWDLVHPSLWPLVYGRTRIFQDFELNLETCLDRIGCGTTTLTETDGGTWLSIHYIQSQLSMATL